MRPLHEVMSDDKARQKQTKKRSLYGHFESVLTQY